jgi:hypothetical protein
MYIFTTRFFYFNFVTGWMNMMFQFLRLLCLWIPSDYLWRRDFFEASHKVLTKPPATNMICHFLHVLYKTYLLIGLVSSQSQINFNNIKPRSHLRCTIKHSFFLTIYPRGFFSKGSHPPPIIRPIIAKIFHLPRSTMAS